MTKHDLKNIKCNLIIIGNGFDLACKEETSIVDFIKHECEKFEVQFSQYKLNFIVWLLCHLLLEDNKASWQAFLHPDQPALVNWMDFEKLINHLLLDNVTFRKIEILYNNPHEHTQFAYNKVEFAIADYFENYAQWHKDLFKSSDNYIDFLEKSVHEFENQLKKYLLSIDKNLDVYIRKELLLKTLRGKYERTNVMDFNYTDLPFDPSNPIFHIHGSKVTECLIGIDPSNKFSGKKNLYKTLGQKVRFTKVYKRLKYSSSHEIQQIVLSKSIDRITFFGHSLGEQDYSYFQSVFDYFDLYNSDVVLVFCYTEYEKNPILKEKDRLTGRVFELINRYGETLSNKDHGNNLLNKLLLEGRLVFNEILPEIVFSEEKVKALRKKYEQVHD